MTADPGETKDGVAPYLAVGCLTAFSGMMACAMIAVLVAKIVGYARGCPADGETGAPCDWLTYALRGGLVGLVLVPTIVLRRMRRGRARLETPSERK
ncbi:MAG: hypothetical protein ABIY52_10455 [Gemmatimonadaceae bacterium]